MRKIYTKTYSVSVTPSGNNRASPNLLSATLPSAFH